MRTLLAILTLAALSAPALAQQRSAARAADEGPVLTLKERRLFLLRLNIYGSRAANSQHIELNSPILRLERRGFLPRQSIDLRSIELVVPVLERSASHEMYLDRAEWSLLFNRQPVPQDRLGNPGEQPDLINLEQSVRITDDEGNWLVAFILNPEQIEFSLQAPVATHETVYDDARAARIDWPTEWPEWVRPALEPSPYIPSDHAFVRETLNDWTNSLPRSMPPAVLAKHLAKRIVDSVQPLETGVAVWPYAARWRGLINDPCDPVLSARTTRVEQRGSNPTPYALRFADRRVAFQLRGFDVDDRRLFRNQDCFVPRIREPVETGRANPAVTANLYAALLRAAGIPARVVIGIELTPAELRTVPDAHLPGRPQQDLIINDVRITNRVAQLRFWNEFFLYDEAANRGEWIPVDLFRQRLESSRAPDIDRPWRYFGNHDELDEIVPITSVYTPFGADMPDWVPALWGWRTQPAPWFFLDGIIRVEAVGLARRPNDGFDRPRAQPTR